MTLSKQEKHSFTCLKQLAKAEAFALKWGSAPNPANFEKFDQTFPLYFLLKTENFRASARKFTFIRASRDYHSLQAIIIRHKPIIIRAPRDYTN